MIKLRILDFLQKIKPEHILLGSILLVGIFFRFYNTPARYGFDNDPTRDILLVQYAAAHKDIPLTGALSGIAPFTFGPWYYYQLIIFYLLFPFQYSPWVFVGISSVVAILIMYKIGALLENKYLGLILAFFMAVSPSETGQTQGLSNPNLVPLYSALTIWFFVRLLKKPTSLGWIFWGIVLGIGINIHYEMVCLLILPLILLFYQRKQILKNVFNFILGFIITFIPLLIFNLQYHWHTVRSFIFYVTQGRTATYIPNSWGLYVKDFWMHYVSYIFGLPSIGTILLLIFTGSIFLWQYKKNNLKPIYVLLFLAFLFDFLFLRYFLSRRDYYYYLFIHPLIFIFISVALYQLTKIKYGTLALLLVLAFFAYTMGLGDFQRLSSRQDFVYRRAQASLLSKANTNRNLSFYVCSDHGKSMAQALTFFLEPKNQSKPFKTKKIGVGDFECKLNYNDGSTVSGYNKKLSIEERLIDLDSLSDADLAKKGWIILTPQTVYRDTVDWWRTPESN